MRIFKDVPNIKFMSVRKYGFIISGAIIAIGIILFFVKGFNMGIDYTGGTSIDISFRDKIDISDVRNTLNKVGLGNSIIQRVGDSERFIIKAPMEGKGEIAKSGAKAGESEGVTKLIADAFMTEQEKAEATKKLDINNASKSDITNFLIEKSITRELSEAAADKISQYRTASTTGLIHQISEIDKLGIDPQVVTILKKDGFLGKLTFLGIESIGPQVGSDMRNKSFWAAVFSLIGMLIYIAFRFKLLYGVSGLLTLVHDTLVTLTFILAFQIEFSLSVLAAILTLVGYSINDTIVIFDRVRDNLLLMKKQKLEIIMDASINQTLSRTVITAGTVFLTVLALFFFGGEVLYGFSFTLLVGVIVGSYSSIYQSCAWLMVWEHKFLDVKKK